ncbi:MAG TPA: DNA-directed RNA polymerase subunit alpha C-terminal domain-containing protein, partial [Candidatus Paceibacterota bacterium]|nr:DNA-directed RNA polymerase subunit alpha C-terminal domain-containing protein [Candidatus Paceibacterota bacterium]
ELYRQQEGVNSDDLQEQILAMPCVLMSISSRIKNSLKAAKCETVRDVVLMREGDLLGLPNFGKGSLQELKEFLWTFTLDLGMLE